MIMSSERQPIVKTEEEIAIIRANCLLVNEAIAAAVSALKEGTTTRMLDRYIETYIRDMGAVPGFKGYMDYPFASCISVNDAVVHGFPDDKPLQNGDVISIDAGALKYGYHSDTAYTVALGDLSREAAQLLRITKKALYRGIAQAVAGQTTGDIGYAIQSLCEGQYAYGVVRDLIGHGFGRHLHEAPEVPNYGKKGKGVRLEENWVIAIEPMVNLGTYKVFVDKDGWTVRTKDRKISAHYEHAVAIKKGQVLLLSDFTPIEKAVAGNSHLWQEGAFSG